MRMGKIVRDRYRELGETDQEAIRQHAVAALNITPQASKTIAETAKADATGELKARPASLFLPVKTSATSDWTALISGSLVSGTGAGLIDGEMTNVAAEERSGMASSINGTMWQVGVMPAFATLGAILVRRAATALTVDQLGLPVNQVGPLMAPVIKGDIAAAVATLPAPMQHGFKIAADAGIFEGFRTIALVAGVVGLVGAALTYLLMRPLTVSHIGPDDTVISPHDHH